MPTKKNSEEPRSIFDRSKVWPYQYHLELFVKDIHGGVPSDPSVIEAWVKSTSIGASEVELRQRIAAKMEERGATDARDVIDEVAEDLRANGFCRDPEGALYYEGRCLKSAIKEAVSIAANAGRIEGLRAYGKFKSGAKNFVAEHIMVAEDRLYFERDGKRIYEPDGMRETQVSTHRGTTFKKEEYVSEVTLRATILTDNKFGADWWESVWGTGEMEGIGASRSQGRGRYLVTAFSEIT